jgi:hypothetical protein
VWAFDPDRVLAGIDSTVNQHFARTLQLQSGAVELLNPDRAMTVVARRAFRRPVVQHVGASVVVYEHRRINAALQFRQPRRIGPRAGRILRSHDVVAAAVHVRVEDIEEAVAIFDARSEHAARHAELAEVELRRPVDDAADLPPMHQVATFEHRYAGEVRERRMYEIETIAGARDARVRVEAAQDGIAIVSRRQRLLEDGIAPGVLEPVVHDGLGLRDPSERERVDREQQPPEHHQSHIVPSARRAIGSCFGEYGNFAASFSSRVTPWPGDAPQNSRPSRNS